MATLQFTDVLSAKDTHSVTVSCPEWGGDVELVTMGSAEWDELEATQSALQDDPAKAKGIRAKYVARCWGDGNGKRTPLSDTQVEHLGNKHPKVIGRLYNAVIELHGSAGSEEAEKN